MWSFWAYLEQLHCDLWDDSTKSQTEALSVSSSQAPLDIVENFLLQKETIPIAWSCFVYTQ